jgi:hypothetical protein
MFMSRHEDPPQIHDLKTRNKLFENAAKIKQLEGSEVLKAASAV